MKNVDMSFLSVVQPLEARYAYAMQGAMEAIHSECYALIVETYISDIDERRRTFQAAELQPAIAAKSSWTEAWVLSPKS